MTSGNFNWLLHTMLFMHTENVIQKQKEKKAKSEAVVSDSDEDELEDFELEDDD